MKTINYNNSDPLHPYSVDDLLTLIRRKAVTFQYKVRIRNHSLEHLERINHELDRRIAQDFNNFIMFYSRLYGFTNKELIDLKFITANLISDLAKENCFV